MAILLARTRVLTLKLDWFTNRCWICMPNDPNSNLSIVTISVYYRDNQYYTLTTCLILIYHNQFLSTQVVSKHKYHHGAKPGHQYTLHAVLCQQLSLCQTGLKITKGKAMSILPQRVSFLVKDFKLFSPSDFDVHYNIEYAY